MGKDNKSKKTSKKDTKDDKKDKNGNKNSTVPVVKIIDKKAMVDQYMENREKYHVYDDTNNVFNGKYFSCTLNKSDLVKNNNKFIIIQILEHDSDGSLIFFQRWGRVGVRGNFLNKKVNAVNGPKMFLQKYKDKTVNHNYQEVIIDYEAEIKKDELKNITDKQKKPKKKFENPLDKDVMDLISLIYDKKMISNSLHELGYDSNKMPLGKLSSTTLIKGLNILKEIEEELKTGNPSQENLTKLSSNFYSQIPHNIGYKKMCNFIIDSTEKVKEKIDMIDALSDMKITLKILENSDEEDDEYENEDEKQIYDCYKKLNCDIRTISESEHIYSILQKYLTAGNNDSYYSNNNLSLIKAYELNRHGEKEKFKDLGNKKLLWHGSRITNFVGILSQGLRIAPPEAPSSGYLYGKGVYFADKSQKSSNYCYPVNNQALILLGEVSLGREDQRTDTDYDLPRTLKEGTDSVHALGSLVPSSGETIDKDVFVPNGDAKNVEDNNYYSSYSEFIVYNVDQIKLRYLLKIKYN